MKCPTCTRRNLTREDFSVVRDGVRLQTATCRHCIAEENRKHNREQRRKANAA